MQVQQKRKEVTRRRRQPWGVGVAMASDGSGSWSGSWSGGQIVDLKSQLRQQPGLCPQRSVSVLGRVRDSVDRLTAQGAGAGTGTGIVQRCVGWGWRWGWGWGSNRVLRRGGGKAESKEGELLRRVAPTEQFVVSCHERQWRGRGRVENVGMGLLKGLERKKK